MADDFVDKMLSFAAAPHLDKKGARALFEDAAEAQADTDANVIPSFNHAVLAAFDIASRDLWELATFEGDGVYSMDEEVVAKYCAAIAGGAMVGAARVIRTMTEGMSPAAKKSLRAKYVLKMHQSYEMAETVMLMPTGDPLGEIHRATFLEMFLDNRPGKGGVDGE